MKCYLAESIGTFILVFAGTAAIVVNDISGGAITHLGVWAVFGLVVTSVIYTIGDVSGAHINPAVTIGGVVAFEAILGGPISGASMNPARSLGPALIGSHPDTLWIYIAAPVSGDLLAIPSCRCIRAQPCCRADV